ncbi:1,3-beta-glucan synthase regulator [Dysgonomonas sp. 521]|uniref:SMI1/KNR4 family protein n=1 Tax=Dysgonomonas sp. 521 TaxID=2302932 RepID=UPI0013D11F8F|nr:SMI1/KNR4 family protein [Dysgonomonas sp. 521]NDV95397.1 1,3-beta-glucan synthase regulator [Dysgonomonas sp. 521]
MEKTGKYIQQLNEEFEYSEGASIDNIKTVEKILGISFPADYTLFLSECGECNFGDTTIYGIYKTGRETSYPVADITLDMRKEYALDTKYFVLKYEVDEFLMLYNIQDNKIYGADILSDEKGELNIGKTSLMFPSFDEFFEDFALLGEDDF